MVEPIIIVVIIICAKFCKYQPSRIKRMVGATIITNIKLWQYEAEVRTLRRNLKCLKLTNLVGILHGYEFS